MNNLLSKYNNTDDIRKVLESRARAYVPEWRFDPGDSDDPDAATALALAFADMFGETAERLGRVPYRYFLYFLNMLETKVRSVSPSTGLVSFTLTSNAERGTIIPENTQLYANVPLSRGETERVTYETTHEITAVPAHLTHMYCVDPRHDVINAIDFAGSGARLFYADMACNLQVHRFSIWHGDVLDVRNPARVTVRLESGFSRYDGGKNTEKLTDPDFAVWSFVRDGVSEDFTRVYVSEGAIVLEMDKTVGVHSVQPQASVVRPYNPAAEAQPEPTPDELPHIECRMYPKDQQPGIMADNITLGSAYLYPTGGGVHITPDYVYYNDISLRVSDPGYLFGKEPLKYDTLLISCFEALSKRGARVNLTFVMHTVIRQTGLAPDGPSYDWDGRFIIDKADAKTVVPDSMFISDVVWEYWNGMGWAHLEVESANINPFHSDEDIRHESISFICPEDMSQSYQNSIESLWIRARIISIENPYSQYGLWQLPFAESVSFDYDYGNRLKKAQSVKIENNAESYVFHGDEIGTGLSLYKPLDYAQHALYLAFDKQPAGLPLSVYIGLGGVGGRSRTLAYERMTRDASGEPVFKPCKVLDKTNGLRDSGIISLYVSEDMTRGSIYGQEAYWLRMVDGDLYYEDDDGSSATVLDRIVLNAAEIVQRQSVTDLYYNTELFESGKVITLPENPVLNCEVFVEGEPWGIVPSLMGAGSDDPVVCLEPATGVLRFGDGITGRVPPAGEQNIRINYSFGGGALGNIPPGSIAGLSSSIPTVSEATNFTSTGGGSDNVDMKMLERIGPARIRHRGRAVTLSDFENLILEEFPEVASVKAYAGMNSDGQEAQSYVTVVVLPKDSDNREQMLNLCKNAYKYLTQRAHCQLVESSRLSVVPALMMTVSAVVEAVADDITQAARTERAIQAAITEKLTEGTGTGIGELPAVADIFDCLRGIPNLSYVERISLEGMYFDGGKQILTALGRGDDFPFACARNGVHVVRFA